MIIFLKAQTFAREGDIATGRRSDTVTQPVWEDSKRAGMLLDRSEVHPKQLHLSVNTAIEWSWVFIKGIMIRKRNQQSGVLMSATNQHTK